MKNILLSLYILGIFSCSEKTSAPAGSPEAKIRNKPAGIPSNPEYWRPAGSVFTKSIKMGYISRYLVFQLDTIKMRAILSKAPTEKNWRTAPEKKMIRIPFPDSTFQNFEVYETITMDSSLAAKFPELKTYGGQGVDDRTANGRFDFIPTGFHAYIMSFKGEVYIDPIKERPGYYLCYYKRDAKFPERRPFENADSIPQIK